MLAWGCQGALYLSNVIKRDLHMHVMNHVHVLVGHACTRSCRLVKRCTHRLQFLEATIDGPLGSIDGCWYRPSIVTSNRRPLWSTCKALVSVSMASIGWVRRLDALVLVLGACLTHLTSSVL